MSPARPSPLNLLLHGTLLLLAVALAAWEPFMARWERWLLADPWWRSLGGLWGLALLGTWVPIGLYHGLDTRRAPAWLYRYKLQPARTRLGEPTVAEALRLGLLNTLLVLPLCLGLATALLRLRGWAPSAELPSLPRLLVQLVVLASITDFVFYLGHRALHRPWWMARVHELHHRWTAPTGLASQYQHPLEFALTGVGPLAVAVLILAPDLATIALFTLLGSINVVVTHSGYALPFATHAGYHDLHHARTVGNFGVTPLWDRIFGTRLAEG